MDIQHIGTNNSGDNDFVLIMPLCAERAKSRRLAEIVKQTLAKIKPKEIIETAEQLHPMQNQRILFAIVLGSSGINLEYYRMLKKIRLNQEMFSGCLGALLVDGMSEQYTKYIARELVLTANMAGCSFIGRPLVEGTASLSNFHIVAEQRNLDARGAYLWSAENLFERLLTAEPMRQDKQRHLLVLHASSKKRSNTYALWQLVEDNLRLLSKDSPLPMEIEEISLREKTINDCAGCSYETCLYYGSKGSCFYGGTISEDVYPALSRCTDLLMVCPNYNDALSAYLTAFINRLTAIYLQQRFYDKNIYSLIVSGYSGSDIIAGQLIAGLCMNKSFFLPAHFAMMETAHEQGSLLKIHDIDKKAASFAANILGL